ncbi:hypothetical protein M5K25_025394 [Dendrobium thyrsiflorum]|uniref:Uncharacterized protein n=1 Tax=Dendrobium thyrsiflorum TaxID=117978 RepID=A0ABD0U479_DENTH
MLNFGNRTLIRQQEGGSRCGMGQPSRPVWQKPKLNQVKLGATREVSAPLVGPNKDNDIFGNEVILNILHMLALPNTEFALQYRSNSDPSQEEKLDETGEESPTSASEQRSVRVENSSEGFGEAPHSDTPSIYHQEKEHNSKIRNQNYEKDENVGNQSSELQNCWFECSINDDLRETLIQALKNPERYEAYFAERNMTEVLQARNEPFITFTEEDMMLGMADHNCPLYVTAESDGMMITRNSFRHACDNFDCPIAKLVPRCMQSKVKSDARLDEVNF